MTSRLSLRREAQLDIRKAARWYDKERAGLGSEFTRAVRAQLAMIERNDTHFPFVRPEIRRALLRRFPYAVYFVREGVAVVGAALRCLYMKTTSVTIRLDAKLERELQALSRQLGRSRSDVIRDALRRHLALRRFEKARRGVLPLAEAQGILSDDDVFAIVS